MSTVKVAQRETNKSAKIQFVDKTCKSNSKMVVPESIASRLTEVNKFKTSNPQELKFVQERANERRQVNESFI